MNPAGFFLLQGIEVIVDETKRSSNIFFIGVALPAPSDYLNLTPFPIDTPCRQYVCCADSHSEMQDWILALRAAIEGSKPTFDRSATAEGRRLSRSL